MAATEIAGLAKCSWHPSKSYKKKQVQILFQIRTQFQTIFCRFSTYEVVTLKYVMTNVYVIIVKKDLLVHTVHANWKADRV